MLPISVVVLACVLSSPRTRAGDVVTVSGRAGGLPGPAIRGTGLTMIFCRVDKTECPGKNLSKRFAPAASVCMKRCGASPKCLNAFYNAKVCYMRGARCDAAARKASTGLYLHRLKDGETCPADTPAFLTTIPKYSTSFCLMRNKSCAGRDLYKKPQKISTVHACLKKCAGISECTMIDFSPGKCAMKGESCEDAELTDTPGSENYLRLAEGDLHCPENREIPSATLVPQTAAPAPPLKMVPIGYRDDCLKFDVFHKYFDTKETHDNSVKACEKEEGKLAEPRSVEEAKCLIHKYLARVSNTKLLFTHLGLKNTPPYKEGGMVGLSGADRSDLKVFWSKGHMQPDGKGRPGGNCVAVTTTSGSFRGSLYGEFHDVNCSHKDGFVCEYRIK